MVSAQVVTALSWEPSRRPEHTYRSSLSWMQHGHGLLHLYDIHELGKVPAGNPQPVAASSRLLKNPEVYSGLEAARR